MSNSGDREVVLRRSRECYAHRATYYGLVVQKAGIGKDTKKELDFVEYVLRTHSTRPVKKIADIACGGGRHIISLAKRGYECTGYDLVPERVEVAKAFAKRMGVSVNLAQRDATKLPRDKHFDAVLALYILYLLPSDDDVKRCLAGVHRLLSPGGVLVCNIFNPFTKGSHWVKELVEKGSYVEEAGGPPSIRRGGSRSLGAIEFHPVHSIKHGHLYGVYFIFFAYGGFARVAVVAEEVRDARRVVPRAIMFALVVSTIVYILVGVAAVGLVGAAELAKSDSPLVDAVGVIGNPTLTYIVSAGGIAATASVLLTSILGVSRMAFAMARRGELPSVMGKLHHKYNSPYASVLGAGVMMIALILFVDLTGVVAVSTFASLFYYAMANVSALRLKSQTRLYSRYIPIVGLATCLVLLILTEPLALEIGLVCLLGGASYYLVRGIGKPSK